LSTGLVVSETLIVPVQLPTLPAESEAVQVYCAEFVQSLLKCPGVQVTVRGAEQHESAAVTRAEMEASALQPTTVAAGQVSTGAVVSPTVTEKLQ